MVLIKVQYDAYNRQFKLLDGECRHSLQDGEKYVLIADVSPQDFVSPDGEILEHVAT